MIPVVRFAPSPTGRIHIGNARTALLNALFARKQGGRFILRYDDTDAERSREEYVEAIGVDLAWLGIVPDTIVRQSHHFPLYAEAAARLKAAGRLYPCYESADELDRRRKRQQARGLPPVYDRAALELSAEDRERLEADGRRPHWRFKLDRVEVAWDDLVRGPSHIDCASLSDPVLIREDGSYLYTLPSVVDDLDMSVTHVIRGEDHVTNTAVQIQLFEALEPIPPKWIRFGDEDRLQLHGAGASPYRPDDSVWPGRALGGVAPIFAHHNLLTTASGEGLSKRSGALSIGGLREAGIESLAVASLAVLTGSSDAVQPVTSLDALGALFDLGHISRNPARFDPAELDHLSARTLHGLAYTDVATRLDALGIVGETADAFWLAVRGNLERLGEAAAWWDIVRGPIETPREDGAFLDEAASLLPAEPWDATVWSIWTAAIKARTGRKGRALFHPLRIALTGRETGPELAALLPLIGRPRAEARLAGRRD